MSDKYTYLPTNANLFPSTLRPHFARSIIYLLFSDYHKIKHDLKPFDRETSNEPLKDIVEAPKPKKNKEPTDVQRKPIIATIRHNDHRVYKAVTFINQKETKPLQIKIPNSNKSDETNATKIKLKLKQSKDSIRNYPNDVKDKSTMENERDKTKKVTKKLKRRPSSPELPRTFQGNLQTEVAKWKPSSITQDTKPYYEAWVDTTLAATTKCSKFDQVKLNKQQVIKTFKRALDLDMASRPDSPVFVKATDEKYVGKITVKRSKNPPVYRK